MNRGKIFIIEDERTIRVTYDAARKLYGRARRAVFFSITLK